MHLPGTLHLALTIQNEAQGARAAEVKIVLAKRAGESLRHILLKLLGYVLFYSPELQIEVGVDQRHKPDLVKVDETGRPLLWIDCGSIGVKRLDRITRLNREAPIVVIKPTEREASTYLRSARPHLTRPEAVEVLAFRPGFLEALAERILDHQHIVATVTGDREHLYLELGGEVIESPVVRASL